MPSPYAALDLDTRTDEYSDRYEDRYGDEYAHSHHHADGYILAHIGTDRYPHGHPELSDRYGLSRIDQHSFSYVIAIGYEHPSRAAALSVAVYLTSLAHGYPRDAAARYAATVYHIGAGYHAEGQRARPDGDLGLSPAAAERRESDGPDGVPDQAGRDGTLPRPVGQFRRTWLHRGRGVPDLNTHSLTEPGTDQDPNALLATLTHEHPIERGSSLGKPGETWRHPHSSPGPGHTHRYAGLGGAFHPDGRTPEITYPHTIGNA